MINQKIYNWLSKRGLQLEEGFAQTLRNLATIYQKANNIRRLYDVYELIGLQKQYISYWENNSSNKQTKKFLNRK